jgi:hypothetical protein
MFVIQVLLGRRDQAANGKNCVECNRVYNNSNSSKKVCFDNIRPAARDHHGFDNQRILVHDRLGGKTSVYDRL